MKRNWEGGNGELVKSTDYIGIKQKNTIFQITSHLLEGINLPPSNTIMRRNIF